MAKLTDKQQRFCEEYLIDLNAKQAAIRAGYSEKTAHSIGSENLTKPEVQNYLSERQLEMKEESGVTAMQLVKEYSRVAFFDIRNLYDENGALKPIHELDDDTARGLASVKTYEERIQGVVMGMNKEVKAYDKIRALDSLGKHLGIFLKDNIQKKPDQPQQTIIINGKEVTF